MTLPSLVTKFVSVFPRLLANLSLEIITHFSLTVLILQRFTRTISVDRVFIPFSSVSNRKITIALAILL